MRRVTIVPTAVLVGTILCGFALTGCSESEESRAAASSVSGVPESASALAAPSASPGQTASPAPWRPSNGIRVKVIVQLTEAVPPERCADAGDAARVSVGSPVTLKTAEGSVVSEAPLREAVEGQAYGPQGYTFGGWSDLEPDAGGQPVTFACFYLADFPDVPPSDGYVASVAGAQDVLYDVPLLTESEGWLTQLVQ